MALKQRLPGAQLKKAAAGASPAAPFPISITADVAVPAEAERYDVEDVKVCGGRKEGREPVYLPGPGRSWSPRRGRAVDPGAGVAGGR